MFSKFDTTVAVCENPAHCPTAADLAEYAEWCERDARNRRTMDYMDSLQQEQGDDLRLMGI